MAPISELKRRLVRKINIWIPIYDDGCFDVLKDTDDLVKNYQTDGAKFNDQISKKLLCKELGKFYTYNK